MVQSQPLEEQNQWQARLDGRHDNGFSIQSHGGNSQRLGIDWIIGLGWQLQVGCGGPINGRKGGTTIQNAQNGLFLLLLLLRLLPCICGGIDDPNGKQSRIVNNGRRNFHQGRRGCRTWLVQPQAIARKIKFHVKRVTRIPCQSCLEWDHALDPSVLVENP